MRSINWTAVSVLFVFASAVFAEGKAKDTPAPDGFETRCGWLDNPTPGNVSLFDRDAEWVIGEQGGHQVGGDWSVPDFVPAQWVSTNAGSYGYGCACLQLKADPRTHEVSAIKSTQPRPLNACLEDPALAKKWKGMFDGKVNED